MRRALKTIIDRGIMGLYSSIMVRGQPHLTLKLDTKEPIELGAFVGAFTSLANEYDRYIRYTNPDLVGEADMYVRDVRSGSVIADLLPYFVLAAPFIDSMDKMLVVEQFVRVWSGRFRSFLSVGGPIYPADSPAPIPNTVSELKDWADAVRAVATDSASSGTLEAATYEDGKRKVRAAFTFSSSEAQTALRVIEERRAIIERPSHADHTRVLMRFTRTDIGSVAVGKPSGERVKIEELSPRSLALVYGSALAEERIKHEIRDADDNVYKRGFVVDVNVRLSSGSPVAYAVTNVHQVIDLSEDE